MTNGSSQGLFVIVAVVIFGIFVVISYLLFRDKLQTGLASIFQDGFTQTVPIDSFFNNTIKDKEYVSTYGGNQKEFTNNWDWDLSPIAKYYGENQVFTLTFELKTKVAGQVLVYNQNGAGSEYILNPYQMKINATTEYKKFAITFKLKYSDKTQTKSLLSFYGTYGTGVEPIVKNVNVNLGNTVKSLGSDYTIIDNYK